MDVRRRACLLGGGMVTVACLAALARHKTDAGVVRADPPQLQDSIPAVIDGWRLAPQAPQLVNPQGLALLDKIYSEVVARTYVDATPYAVMLSVAYGHDQRGGLEAHKPEVCYPAQGFMLHEQVDHVIKTPFGALRGRRLRASLGARHEPITYWFATADRVTASAWERRTAQLRSLATGTIPDGILVRVSSIDSEPQRAWAKQETFVTQLLRSLPERLRLRLTGPASA